MKQIKDVPFTATNFRDGSGITESDEKSCAVRAIATCFGIDYLVAYAVLANNGRQHSRGTYRGTTHRTVKQLCEKLGYSYTIHTPPIRMRATDIALANKNNLEARILMFTKGHVTCFVNGKLHDTFIDTNFVSEIISITKQNPLDMTNIKDLTQGQREQLINELSEKIARKSFIKDEERDKAVKLLNMLSRHEASDKDKVKEEENISITLKFDL